MSIISIQHISETFDIHRGELIGLIGSSEMERTALLHNLAALSPSENGIDISKQPLDIKNIVKYLSDTSALKDLITNSKTNEQSILLFDSLKTKISSETWEVLRSLSNQGVTILVSISYADDAAFCDHIAILAKGNIQTLDTPENMLRNFTRRLFAIKSANNNLLLQKLENHPEIRNCYIVGEYIHVTFEDDRPREIHATEMKEIKPTITDYLIETIFLKK